MPKLFNNMDSKSEEQFIVMQDIIEANKEEMKSNKQDYDEKIMNLTEYFEELLTSTITSLMDDINISKSSQFQKYSPNS